MALVKKFELGGKGAASRGAAGVGAAPVGPTTDARAGRTAAAAGRITTTERRALDRTRARQEKAAERIGAATEELASGITEAAAAAEELRRALEQIAAAAEEAAGAANESQKSVTSLGAVFTQARDQAELSRRRTDALTAALIETGAQIEALVASVQANTGRQMQSVGIVATLESQAANIGDITRAVGDISDQTNLLALNAAIEAARAGDHGRGFAVVADEVRAFAEISEKSAREVQGLAKAIGAQIRDVAQRIKAAADAARIEAENGLTAVTTLAAIRSGMTFLAQGSQAVLAAVLEAEIGAREAQRGAEQIASAAEEQSAATAEAQRAVQQQSASLDQSQQTAHALAELADMLQSGTGVGSGAEQVGSAAEELSATVQELSGAAGEILAAIEQISAGAQAQAAATQQSTAAMAQIEKAAISTRDSAARAVERVELLTPQLEQSRETLATLTRSIVEGLDETRAVIGLIGALETSSRRVEKIVDSIALVAVQTNMLAVSGSVEAARAGEFGRGFAVVSADIRNLARDSAENADRIKDVVRVIQDQTVAVRRDLEQIAAGSQSETGRNQAIVEKLRNSEADMAAVRSGAAEILAGSGSILQSAREVLAGTQQVAAAAEEASGAAAQAATAARQQARGAEDLAAAIEEIASLADELQIAGS